MTFAPFGNIDLNPIYEFLNVLNLDQIFSFEFGKFLYRFYQNLLPNSAIGTYFESDPYVNNHSYGLRSRTANIPARLVSRTKFAEKSIQFSGLKFWNNIPSYIQSSDSLNIFKSTFRKFLIEGSGQNDDLSLSFTE